MLHPLVVITYVLVYIVCIQVEVTRFEDLEETHAEVKLKQTLWESQREWEHDYETWTTVSPPSPLKPPGIEHLQWHTQEGAQGAGAPPSALAQQPVQ